MGFLAPLLLALGAAAVVPILLHLLQRHQGPRVVFPALRYLRRAEKESARKIRLRQILLLLLRVSAILLLALAAARPFFRGAGASHEPSAVAIILDNSLSSGAVTADRRALDVLKARAQETLLAAGPDDRFWLIRAGAPWEPALPGDAATTAARVRETEPTHAASDLSAAVAHAAALLAAGAEGRAREIHILSDAQQSAFPAAVNGLADVSIVAWTPDEDAPLNRSVRDVELGGGMAPIAGERATIAASLAGDGDDTLGVRLVLDGRTVAAGTAPLGSSAVLPFPARPIGITTGYVEVDADALRADDRRYFAATVVPPPSVDYTGRSDFIDEALAVLAEAGRIRRTTSGGSVAILPGAAGIESLRAGASAIVLPPASPLELPALNRRLAAARVPWRYSARTGGGEARIMTPAEMDPVLRPLQQVAVRDWYVLERAGAAATDSVLFALSTGSPWAVRGERAVGGAYVLLATPLSDSASTLPTSPAMLPLLDRLTGVWTGSGAALPSVEPGAEVILPARADGVLLPDGTTEAIGAGSYRVSGSAGAYLVMAGNDTIGAFAVNAPAAESDLTLVSADGLRERFADADVATVTDAEDWPARVYQQRLGAESWRPFALLALLLLLFEALLAASGGTRRAGGTAAAPPAHMAPTATSD